MSAPRTNGYRTRRAFRFAARTQLGDDLLFGGVDREATSTPSGLVSEFWGEERLDARIASWFFSPSVGIRYARYGRRAWNENGADALSLTVPDQIFSFKQADVGLRFGRATGRVRPEASFTYRRGLGDRQTHVRLTLRGSSVKPGRRRTRNRSRHLHTLLLDTRSRLATARLVSPSAQASTRRDRSASRCAVVGRRVHCSNVRRSSSVSTIGLW
jgi:Autotransporter beta-domain